LSAESGIDGNVTTSAQRHFTGNIVPNVSASALIKRGESSFNLSGGSGRGDYTEEGFDRLVAVPGGEQLEHRRKVNTIRPRDPYLSGSWALEQGENRAIRLNARWAPSTFFLVQANHVIPTGGAERDDQLVEHYRLPAYEIGGDITRRLAGGAIKFVGLFNRRKRDALDAQHFRTLGGTEVIGGFEQTDLTKRGETVGRLSWSRPNLLGVNFEAGGEVAYNTLDSQIALFVLHDGGGRTQIDLPIDNATVQELRGEVYAKAAKDLSKNLRVDFGLNYEMSRLKVRGDAIADRTLKFLKPSVTLDWNRNGWHGQLSVRRTVAQLDFYDFISAAELSTDRINGGNANLLPQRTWEARLLGEHPLLGDGKVRVELGYDQVSLFQDRVLTPEGFDAPGNIGTGTRRYIDLTVDAPLARFGLSGTRLKGNLNIQKTRVDDPIWGTPRRWSGFYPAFNWNLELRRDKGQWAYGVAFFDRAKFTFFRTDELDSNRNLGPYSTAFVEFRPSPRTTLTFDVDNLLNTEAERHRIFFDPNRSNSEPVADELRRRNIHLSFQLTLKQTFGGGRKGDGVAK
jgi:hypothetical protein